MAYPPDDILFLIIQHLHNDRPKASLRFWDIAYWTEDATWPQEFSDRTKTLRSLMLTSGHLYSLVRPFFYRNVLVREWSVEKQQHITWTFYQTLNRDPELAQYIHSAIISCRNFEGYDPGIPVFAGQWEVAHYELPDPNGTTPAELSKLLVTLFFRCRNMQSLTLFEFNAWEALELDSTENNNDLSSIGSGTSPITHLTLTRCGAKESALASLLSWPKALKSLHYDANQGAWGMHYGYEYDQDQDQNQTAETSDDDEEGGGGGVEDAEWTCAAFVHALQPQKHSLTELILTREDPAHEGLFVGPRIDLSDFKALTALRIFELFLQGVEDPSDAWRGLPPNLETLEVFYDDIGSRHARFFYEYAMPELGFSSGDEEESDSDAEREVEIDDQWPGGQWLRALLEQRKEGKFPDLKTIRVYTPEWEPVLRRGQRRRKETHLCMLPETVRDLASEGGVEVDVWIVKERYRKADDFDAMDIL
ncbi:uncharacterized protein BDV17DRAFT_274094 [Aspergillus undulatus]|uniref:uncharacterized protein n=1 Tax=Aspergillus undulatus TaxID=1810928 RepID=UPI003CCDCE4F